MEIESLRLKFPKANPQQERSNSSNKKCSNSKQQKMQQHNLENATMLTTKTQQRTNNGLNSLSLKQICKNPSLWVLCIFWIFYLGFKKEYHILTLSLNQICRNQSLWVWGIFWIFDSGLKKEKRRKNKKNYERKEPQELELESLKLEFHIEIEFNRLESSKFKMLVF